MGTLDFSNDYRFFDSIAKEEVNLFGAPVKYWRRSGNNRDAVWGEIRNDEWLGPFEFNVSLLFEGSDIDTEANEKGRRETREAHAKVPRCIFDDFKWYPTMGDILVVWNKITGKEYSFDVIKITPVEFVYESPKITWIDIWLKSRSEAKADRRLSK